MNCEKCRIKREGEEHHVHPKYMMNPSGIIHPKYNFKSRIFLCHECHLGKRGIHQSLILPLLKSYSNKSFLNSESSLWFWISQEKKENVINKIILETIRWVKNGNP